MNGSGRVEERGVGGRRCGGWGGAGWVVGVVEEDGHFRGAWCAVCGHVTRETVAVCIGAGYSRINSVQRAVKSRIFKKCA